MRVVGEQCEIKIGDDLLVWNNALFLERSLNLLKDKKVSFRQKDGSKKKRSGIVEDIIIEKDGGYSKRMIVFTNRMKYQPIWRTVKYIDSINRIYNSIDPYGEENWEE